MNLHYDDWKSHYKQTVDFIDEWIAGNARSASNLNSLKPIFFKELKMSEFRQQIVAALIKDHCDIDWTNELYALLSIVVAGTSKHATEVFKNSLVGKIFSDYEERIEYMFIECLAQMELDLKIAHREREEIIWGMEFKTA